MRRTADEDFGVLLEAAALYDERVEEEGEEGEGRYPRLIFIITGI